MQEPALDAKWFLETEEESVKRSAEEGDVINLRSPEGVYEPHGAMGSYSFRIIDLWHGSEQGGSADTLAWSRQQLTELHASREEGESALGPLRRTLSLEKNATLGAGSLNDNLHRSSFTAASFILLIILGFDKLPNS